MRTGRADVAEHLQRAIEVICADNPLDADSSAEERSHSGGRLALSPDATNQFQGSEAAWTGRAHQQDRRREPLASVPLAYSLMDFTPYF